MTSTRPPFQSFLDEHAGAVLSFLRALAGPQEAEDLFQETFLAALRAYPQMDGRHPRAWVLTIARRKAIDNARSRSRRAEPAAELPDTPAPEHLHANGNGVWSAVAALSGSQRAAIALRFAADLPYAEIGAALGCSEAAARRRVHDGLRVLRETVDEEALQ